MKVRNMQSSSGRDVANQFIIQDGNVEYFQSYDSIIAKKENGKVYLDEYYWNYSRTTSKYRNQFLGKTTQEIEKNIRDGIYILGDLN